jgi:type VII secretion protein EssA
MKRNFSKRGTMLFLLPFLFSFPVYANADSNGVNVKPNQYQEKEIKRNTDYLHEDSLYQKRDQLSEDQLMLKFEGQKPNKNTLLADHLFKETKEETNTITAKSKQLDVSFQRKLKASEEEIDSKGESNQSFLITGLFVGVILLGIGALFFLIPKTTQ